MGRVGPTRRWTVWRTWLSSLLLILLFLPVAPHAQAADTAAKPLPTTMLLGIAAHAWWLDPYQDQILAAYQDLHVQVVRISIDWKRVEAVPGTYDWSLYDRTLLPLAERHIAIVADLVSFPAWTSTDPLCAQLAAETAHCLPRAGVDADWARFCAAAAARYPFIGRWEIWNEPELWAGIRDAKVYLDYFTRAYRAIHANHPGARVAISTLVGWDWVADLYWSTPAQDRVWDAVAYHPYPIPGGISGENPAVPIDINRINRLRLEMERNGTPGRPIWITEFGWSRSPEEQAVRLRNALAWFAGRTDIELVCLHQLLDWSGDDPAPDGYGLMRADPRPPEENPPPTTLTPKEPYYSAFRDYPRVTPPPPPDTPTRHFFPPTGQTVSGDFLAYWQAHGGLAQFGYPLTEVRWDQLEDGRWYQVQYFERARFEYHPENQAPYNVLLGQFGRWLHPADPPLPPPAALSPDTAYFAQTGHLVTGRFLTYWQANGGLAQFGFPISEVMQEQLEDGQTYQVQYFERARFEWHPANRAPYDVELGQFGRRVLATRQP
ncbi:MAG: hypothetical protein ACTHMU_06990 [Thermomicrobiales bacterium]